MIDAAGREIRALDEFEQLRVGEFGFSISAIVACAEFAQIVRRDGGRHADRDAARSVRQQIGKRRRKNDRLFVLAVIGRAEIDGVLVEAFEQRLRNFGQRLSV